MLFERSLPAEPANVGALRRDLGKALQPLDLSPGRVADIVLVVSEALSNASLHAYIGLPRGAMALVAAASSRTLRVTVTDQGRGMIPRTDSPGLGLGLGVMAGLTDALEVSSPGGLGTQVRVSFEL